MWGGGNSLLPPYPASQVNSMVTEISSKLKSAPVTGDRFSQQRVKLSIGIYVMYIPYNHEQKLGTLHCARNNV